MLGVDIDTEQSDQFDVSEQNEEKEDGSARNRPGAFRRSRMKEFATRQNHSLNQTIKDETGGGEKISIRPTFSLDDCGSDQINTSRVDTLVESDESGIRVILEKCEELEDIGELLEDLSFQESADQARLPIDPATLKSTNEALEQPNSAAFPSKVPSILPPQSPCSSINEGVPRKTCLGVLDRSLRKSKSFDESQSDKRQRPLVNKFTDFLGRNTASISTNSNPYTHLSSWITSEKSDRKHDSRRQRFRRQASEPKKSNVHPEKQHPHKRTTSDPISHRLKRDSEPAADQIGHSVNNSTDNNSLGIPPQRRAWASTPARSIDQSPTLLLRKKFANSRATSLPESCRHPLAFENTSFDEIEGHMPVEPVVHPVVNVDEVFARCSVQDWSLEDLLIEEKKIRLREYSWVLNDHNQVFGAKEVIHLPRKLSIVDRKTFEKVRYVRRNAIHIYDRDEFKQILKRHIIRKHAFSYEY